MVSLSLLTCLPTGRLKTWLMISHTPIYRFIALTFILLVGYSLVRAIQLQSVIAILLAVISLSACIYFLYLLAKAKKDFDEESSETT